MRRLAKLTSALSLLLALGSNARAEKGNIKLGQLALHPSAGIEVSYDDNIYLVPPDENGHAVAGGGVRGSWIMSNTAKLALELPVGDRHKFAASYGMKYDIYQTQSSANNAFNQFLDGSWDFKGARTRAKVSDAYLNTQDRQFNPNSQVVAGALVARERRWQNTLLLAGEYALGEKFFAGADAQHYVLKYLNPSLGANMNYYTQTFGMKAGYMVQPKTRVYSAVHRGLTHYTAGRPANHKDWLVDFGVEGQLTAKIKGQIQGGYQYREYDPDPATAGQDHITSNFQSAVRLNYQATQRDQLNLVFIRALNESVANGQGGDYYVTTGVGLDGEHSWTKLVVGGGLGWQRDQYSESITLNGQQDIRRDDLFSAAVKADYKLREWLMTGVAYKHVTRDSVFSRQFDYKNNVTSANVKVVF